MSKQGGCKHKRVWSVKPRYSELIVQAPDYPGVVIQTERIQFCEQCGKFRTIGEKNQTSPWKNITKFAARQPLVPSG